MSARAPSARRLRPSQSDVYTWLLVLSALFMLAADLVLFMPLHHWYQFMGAE